MKAFLHAALPTVITIAALVVAVVIAWLAWVVRTMNRDG